MGPRKKLPLKARTSGDCRDRASEERGKNFPTSFLVQCSTILMQILRTQNSRKNQSPTFTEESLILLLVLCDIIRSHGQSRKRNQSWVFFLLVRNIARGAILSLSKSILKSSVGLILLLCFYLSVCLSLALRKQRSVCPRCK